MNVKRSLSQQKVCVKRLIRNFLFRVKEEARDGVGGAAVACRKCSQKIYWTVAQTVCVQGHIGCCHSV